MSGLGAQVGERGDGIGGVAYALAGPFLQQGQNQRIERVGNVADQV